MNTQNSNSHKTGDQKWEEKNIFKHIMIVFVSKNNTENNIHKETSYNIHWSGKFFWKRKTFSVARNSKIV